MSEAPRPPAGLWLRGYVGLYLVFLYLPLALMPVFSFNDSVQASFPLNGFTLAWYRALANDAALHRALVTSLFIASISATAATVCGVTVVYLDVLGGSRLAGLVSTLARLPIFIPGVVLGVALLILVNLAGAGPSRLAVICGHVLVALPTTVVVMRGRFASIPRALVEAAEDLGATGRSIFLSVMLPLALPAVGAAFMLAFLISFDEFIVAFFLSGDAPTLPLYIWGQLRFPKALPSMMALGAVILFGSIVVAALAEALRRRGLSSVQPVASPIAAGAPADSRR